jgi:hypothetical protein
MRLWAAYKPTVLASAAQHARVEQEGPQQMAAPVEQRPPAPVHIHLVGPPEVRVHPRQAPHERQLQPERPQRLHHARAARPTAALAAGPVLGGGGERGGQGEEELEARDGGVEEEGGEEQHEEGLPLELLPQRGEEGEAPAAQVGEAPHHQRLRGSAQDAKDEDHGQQHVEGAACGGGERQGG